MPAREDGWHAGSRDGAGRRLRLTDRQLDVIEQVAQGKTNREVAEALGISPATVKRHLERAYERSGVRTRSGLAARWQEAADRGEKLR